MKEKGTSHFEKFRTPRHSSSKSILLTILPQNLAFFEVRILPGHRAVHFVHRGVNTGSGQCVQGFGSSNKIARTKSRIFTPEPFANLYCDKAVIFWMEINLRGFHDDIFNDILQTQSYIQD